MWSFHNPTLRTDLSTHWSTPPPTSTISSWDHLGQYVYPENPSSSSACENNLSISASAFTKASSHSALTADSPHQPPMETVASSNLQLMFEDHVSSPDHLWSLNSNTCVENLLDMSQSACSSRVNILEQVAPDCDDYSKKMDSYSYNLSDRDRFRSWSAANATQQESNYAVHLPSEYHPPRGMVEGTIDSHHQYCPCKMDHSRNKITSCGSAATSMADLISFSSHCQLIGQPSLEVKAPRLRHLPNMMKPTAPKNRQSAREDGISGITSGVNRRRCDQLECSSSSSAEKPQKKHKHENSTVTSSSKKALVPKVKLGDRIATLQQIVSPFGKTDTASVLKEAIAYIKFLQEQVQLLISNPYLKANPHMEYPWGGQGQGVKLRDLRSRGFCLGPISCTPQACRENTGADFWASPYRGDFYSHR
ncbi:hypothetical protein SAY86_030199 [Trapa natans]|uniref:BHLH domain-containing protein n=1 Tax=Trapa natans TaxID=22666 RepID=A0AAN7MQR8_TRANT|nr:hypothetical protein SAY86_030199 [Trapa natans]